MKKNDWLLLTAVALYSFLFYQQGLGINFFIFTLFLLAALININHELLKSKNWLLAAAGSLLSAGCVAYYGNSLSFIANFVSLSLLSGLSCNPRTSVIFSLISSWYSYVTAAVFIVRDYLENKQLQVRQSGNPMVTRSWLIGLPVAVVIVFFFMYRAANPLFYNFTQQLSFSFISWGWLIFTLGGFILIYGFFYHRPIAELVLIDALATNQLYPREEQTTTFLGQRWSLNQELFTGVILLSLLNLLLLVVNGLDLNFLYLGVALPTGMTYSESVHQGIGMLITSILVAIAIILFYFRGNLNFYPQNKNLKLLAYGWIFQNAFMLISTAYRNYFYIQEYSLTYKRIGVFIYLLLVLAGLITTSIKIARIKSNWYLFRQNAWAAYLVLVLACFFNWDLLITTFNIKRAQNQQKPLDREYLLALSEVNLPELLQLQNHDDKTRNPISVTLLPTLPNTALTKYFPDSTLTYKTQLHAKLIDYLVASQQTGWRSWNWTKQRVFRNIQVLEQTKSIPQLLLPEQQLDTLAFVAYFPHVVELDLRDNNLQDLSRLQHTRQLERLDVSENKLTSISSLPALPRLKALSIDNNSFTNAQALQRLPALEYLDLAKTNLNSLATLPTLPQLTYLNLSDTNVPRFAALQQYPKLETLLLRNSLRQLQQPLPTLPSVRSLDISDNGLGQQKSQFVENLKGLSQVTHLNASDNDLESLNLAKEIKTAIKSTDSVTSAPTNASPAVSILLPFTQLKSLNLAGNKLKLITELQAHPALQELNLAYNKIQDLTSLAALPALEIVDLQGNNLIHIDPLASVPSLKELNLADNRLNLNPGVFKQLSRLAKLDISGNKISDIAALNNCTSLRYLNVSQNHLTSLHVCQHFSRLEYLQVDGNPIQDYTALYNLKDLKILIVSNDISEADYQGLSRALPHTKIHKAAAENSRSNSY